jgi:hypothetical protein
MRSLVLVALLLANSAAIAADGWCKSKTVFTDRQDVCMAGGGEWVVLRKAPAEPDEHGLVPTYDIDGYCAAVGSIFAEENAASAAEGCAEREREARAALPAIIGRLNDVQRANCERLAQGRRAAPGSYQSLLYCIKAELRMP